MPQSLANVLVHLVFSTKDRCACLPASIRPALHAYLATVARETGCECPRVGGMTDPAFSPWCLLFFNSRGGAPGWVRFGPSALEHLSAFEAKIQRVLARVWGTTE